MNQNNIIFFNRVTNMRERLSDPAIQLLLSIISKEENRILYDLKMEDRPKTRVDEAWFRIQSELMDLTKSLVKQETLRSTFKSVIDMTRKICHKFRKQAKERGIPLEEIAHHNKLWKMWPYIQFILPKFNFPQDQPQAPMPIFDADEDSAGENEPNIYVREDTNHVLKMNSDGEGMIHQIKEEDIQSMSSSSHTPSYSNFENAGQIDADSCNYDDEFTEDLISDGTLRWSFESKVRLLNIINTEQNRVVYDYFHTHRSVQTMIDGWNRIKEDYEKQTGYVHRIDDLKHQFKVLTDVTRRTWKLVHNKAKQNRIPFEKVKIRWKLWPYAKFLVPNFERTVQPFVGYHPFQQNEIDDLQLEDSQEDFPAFDGQEPSSSAILFEQAEVKPFTLETETERVLKRTYSSVNINPTKEAFSGQLSDFTATPPSKVQCLSADVNPVKNEKYIFTALKDKFSLLERLNSQKAAEIELDLMKTLTKLQEIICNEQK